MIQIPKIPVPIHSNRKFSGLEILQYIVLISVVLYFGKALFIPLSFSLLISFILYPVCKWMEKKGIAKSISILLSIFTLLILFGAIIYLLVAQMVEFLREWDTLRVKLLETTTQLSAFLAEQFGISIERQETFFKNSINNSGTQTLSLLRSTFFFFF